MKTEFITMKDKYKLAFLVIFSLCVCTIFGVPTSFAALPTSTTVVGDIVTDPETGTDVTVTGLLQNKDEYTYGVTTDTDRRIYTTTNIDDIFPDDNGDWTVNALTTNAQGYVEEITMARTVVTDSGPPEVTETETQSLFVASDFDASVPGDAVGAAGDPEGDIDPPPPAAGDVNNYHNVRKGASGDDGNDGYGVRVCIPYTDICTIIGYSGTDGEDGSDGPDDNPTISSAYGSIETVSSKLAGIKVVRIGGNGGDGGDAYGNIDGRAGGDAGDGGDVTLTTEVTISTNGYKGHGIFAQSRAGTAGKGGSGYIWSSGGSGGSSAQGGTVNVTNNENGLIGTTGNYAYGIFAQSLGGAASSGGDSWGIVGKGGSSRVGGSGGRVDVTHKGDIITDGDGSHGIFAQSLGGTGGDGGNAGGIVGLGGDGSTGGDGGSVSVTTAAGSSIATLDIASHGILAQSIGGGGGNGGVGGGIVGLGGGGSGGGDGSKVSVSHNGLIVTREEGSYGILAQSIGGGGGNAGVSAGLVALGSSGSGGGHGDLVSVNTGSAASITTVRNSSHAILAQSIGGGGGTGGTGGGAVAIGGSGGAGGDGGSVAINSAATIETHGDYSRAVYAQSIGAGGGDGGAGGGVVSIGGSGDGGGNGGTVSIVNNPNGDLETWGFGSDAIFAQSIGGGGGSGAGSGGLVSLGGDGDGGGSGDTVTVNNSGSVITYRGFSDAIFAQSVGGGGGSGGGSGGGVSLGGSGSGGGDGGEVNVTNSGTIITWGVGEEIIGWTGTDLTLLGGGSSGIFAQSIGGGGGSGAGSGGLVSLGGNAGVASHGGRVGVDNSGNITTWSSFSSAIYAQSVGGGGGFGAGSGGLVSLGGDGSGGGDGNVVAVTNSKAALQTSGSHAKGIFAQSVGGGGGSGGGSGGVVSLGGDGSSGGDGGAVTVTSIGGSVSTAGNYSDAIFAQSVGGGGGDGTGSGGAVSLGGDGSGGGSASDISVTNSSILNTFADFAKGIFAQSVGGGGGSGGGSGGAVSLGGNSAAGGSGGNVSVNNSAQITTRETDSEGIFAQSVGGGGGSGAGSGGAVSLGGNSAAASHGNTVNVINSGRIVTLLKGSDAIFAQSIGGGGGQASGGGGSGGAVSLGGAGGAGGDGDIVEVTNTNAVLWTEGDSARGIFAQSIGGGGGSGGGSGGAVSLGGGGGSGGDGGNIRVTNMQSNITTSGKFSDAIFAQSIGGGGGDGTGSGGAVSLGSDGSEGGSASNVTVTNSSVLNTSGDYAEGIFAQSVGGGGGSGGGSGGAVSLGGSGAGAGDAGSVTVTQGDGVSVGGISTQGKFSDAIFAQSVGGGGGRGAGSGGLISIGGGGSGGATAGVVQVTNYDTLLTAGNESRGIFAQSVGGGGGDGGGSGGLIALGGSGSGASDGDSVTVTNSGSIGTSGGSSSAIFAQSVGGGGGSGGTAGGAFFTMGGDGDSGGNAGTVSVTSSNNLITIGNDSDGVFAQSLGGGGGNAGSAASGFVFAGVAIGSDGGVGGDGNRVSVTIQPHIFEGAEVQSAISTSGDRSSGIFAQSVGGGGGNGGSAVQGTLGTLGAVSIAIGGSGGAGGAGEDVTVNAAAQISTSGDDSDGLIAQSIGGGGGSGGFAVAGSIQFDPIGGGAVAVGVGGSGGDGGDGDAVLANLMGSIATHGDQSGGLLAQSVGGGGGNGGFNVTSAVSGGGVGSGAVSVGVGGSGGGGGNGSKVSSTVVGNVSTFGKDADALVVQSIGGGGGNGGFTIASTISGAGAGSGAITAGVGGSGDAGGDGAGVTLDLTGNIATVGNESGGVLAQSVGGGGGNGGFNISSAVSGAGVGSGAISVGVGGGSDIGGDGGTVNGSVTGNIVTQGADADGVVFQSVGGGGGNGGFNITGAISGAGGGSGTIAVGVGGAGAGGGVSNTVVANVFGDVSTHGNRSDGVLAQSIGGGGGNGGFDITGAISGAGAGSGGVAVGVGGAGGSGGDAAVVTATVSGDKFIVGNKSTAITVQSIGGGGGTGGFSINGSISGAGTGSGGVTVGIGGSGGGGGTSSTVSANISGTMLTEGDESGAVVVQSIGGGGGNGSFSIGGAISGAGTGSGAVFVGVGGSGGDGGSSGSVTADMSSHITTLCSKSDAVVVQSIGGGGGNGGLTVADSISGSGGGSGAVAVGIGGTGGGGGSGADIGATLTGTLYTEGNESRAFVAQSVGGGGGNGGVNVSGSVSLANSGSGAVGVGVGGFGGDGGDAGNVDAAMSGILRTLGVDSGGVLAQSLGGGGGQGGVNVTDTINVTGSGAGASVALGVGGFGGGGGDGGIVSLVRTGDSQTMNDGAVAITAQSIGGGGGNGGVNVSGAANLVLHGGGAAVSAGLGGFGGSGGTGGNVSTTVRGHVYTGDVAAETGCDAIGVLVQSVGGSGGHGGTNVSGSLSVALNGTSASVGLGVGGFGGGGGDSGSANLDLNGDVVTTGADAHGVMAQSIAGGGGNGGLNVSGAVAVTNIGQSYSAAIGVGGFGGDGGNAGVASTRIAGNVLATGLRNDEIIDIPDMVVDGETLPGTGYSYRVMEDGSHGVLTQSVGGGGGNGGINISGGISAANPTVGRTGSLVLGVGGFGGAGGDAGDVTSSISGEWTTATGDGRAGIFAQSVGGGGGNGGINISGGIVIDGPMIVGVGGFGGAGGTGGNVTVDAETNLRAEGKDAVGLLAQSIGGGGGNGAINISGAIAVNKKGTLPSVTFGIGGFGGAGAVSGDVAVNQNGTLTVNGKSGHGLLAQSIAGGGGNGGLNIASSINHSSAQAVVKKSDMSIVVGLGGHAGDGADAGDVSVVSTGAIVTQEDCARGIFAQSIGGGGGTGGMNVSSVFADQGSPIIVGIGGFGGGGGHAGSVTVTRGDSENLAGKVETSGVGAIGIEASSIGGGGGDAGMNFLISIATGGSSGTTESIDSNPYKGKVDDSVITNYNAVIAQLTGNNSGSSGVSNPYAVQLAIGGDGGVAGHGDAVSVIDYSDITTHGSQSHGILAQSIGGGGGNATLNLGLGYAPNAKAVKIALGGQPGDGGNGATVHVDHHGDIETVGKDAVGIIAQSIGGGGGNVGFDFVFNKTSAGSVALTIGRKGGSGGSGGDVDLSSNGIISTIGDNAYGLLAQSVGNGGGNSSSYSAGFSSADNGSGETSGAVSIGIKGGIGGEAGSVILNGAGHVTTYGEKAHAIFAQSIGGGGGNGGNANTGAITAPAVGVSLGGTGGIGGIGQHVTVDNLAAVETYGDKAVGILAQSIGGGGGTGGAAYSGGLKTSGSGVQVTVGGSGGTGADGGKIEVDNAGTINTRSERAHAIVAQSIGGGGGDGGMVINGLNNTSENSARVFVSVGGDGGSGGIGKSVNVNSTGVINTRGKEAVGVLAQSIGGGGGSGSTVITSSFSSASGGATIGLGIGGSGGTGGVSGDVAVGNFIAEGVDNSGTIITEGNGAHGVFALSIGGGGGTGSTVITTTNSLQTGATAPSTALLLSIGGDGGTGGAAGKVTAKNNGLIVTCGDGAHGIVAESIGGGGGNGGLSVSGNLLIGSMASSGFNSAISIGGDGGTGNIGNDVLVENSGTIETFGKKSYGIFAQSIGGGGGNGGTSVAVSVDPTIVTGFATQSTVLSIGVGGSGGDGAIAGNVTVNHSGSITTNGADTYGIYAQSVGGGGGTSAFSYSSPFWMAADMMYTTLLGGKDSSSGIGGDVSVNSTGTIVTNGANSSAIFTQAISSGGGNLNMYLDISKDAGSLNQEVIDIEEVTSLTEDLVASVKGLFILGSDLVFDNDGGTVISSHVGDIFASGDNSSGLVVQSIGGGGGASLVELLARPQDSIDLQLELGATNSNNVTGGAINVNRTGQVVTSGAHGKGVSVQSVGGGGGSLNLSLTRTAGDELVVAGTTSVRMGSVGGVGHDSDNIVLDMSGDIYTTGEHAQGILVQSIGGGGGEMRLTGTGTAAVLLGGQQKASGNGGNIALSNSGLISTVGEQSHGVFLQTLGGGGGAVFSDLDEAAVNLTMSTNGIGNGGSIQFSQSGMVTTQGTGAYGAFVQSIGGGGGVVDTLFDGSAGGCGNAGDLDLTFTDDVLTYGENSVGIFSQSVTGNGSSGDIDLQVEGNVLASAEGSSGIYAESSASSGTGNITMTVNGDWVLGGSGNRGYGISLVGGDNNILISNANIATVDGFAGMAIFGTTGSEIVTNYEIVIGNVNLGAGQNSFYNMSGASILSGRTLNVGSGNSVTNAGSFSPGGLDNLMTTDLSGNFVQTSAGIYTVDLNFEENKADLIQASGSADVSGTVELTTYNPEDLMPGEHIVTIISGADGVSNSGLEVDVQPSAVINYQIVTPDAQSLAIGLNIDFSPTGLTRNQDAIGGYFNDVQLAGGSESMDPYIRYLFLLSDAEELADTYAPLVPDYYDNFTQSTVLLTQQFVQPMMMRMCNMHRTGKMPSSLPQAERFLYQNPVLLASNGSDYSLAQLLNKKNEPYDTYGMWINVTGFWGKQDSTQDFALYDYSSRSIVGGLDTMLGDKFTLGLSLGQAGISLDVDDNQGQGDIDSIFVAMYASCFTDRYYLDGVLSCGRHNYDNVRNFTAFSDPKQTTSDHHGHSLSVYGESGYNFRLTDWLLQPFVALQYVYLDESGFETTGAGALNLVMENRYTKSLAFDLGGRVSRAFETSIGTIVPEISASWNYDLGLDDRTLTASFAGFRDASFTIQGRKEIRHKLKMNAGLNFLGKSGFSSALKYTDEWQNGSHVHGIIGELRIEF